jgi:hypothetical protein
MKEGIARQGLPASLVANNYIAMCLGSSGRAGAEFSEPTDLRMKGKAIRCSKNLQFRTTRAILSKRAATKQ